MGPGWGNTGTETDTSYSSNVYYIENVLEEPPIQPERVHHTPVRRLGRPPVTHGTRRSWLLASTVRGRR